MVIFLLIVSVGRGALRETLPHLVLFIIKLWSMSLVLLWALPDILFKYLYLLLINIFHSIIMLWSPWCESWLCEIILKFIVLLLILLTWKLCILNNSILIRILFIIVASITLSISIWILITFWRVLGVKLVLLTIVFWNYFSLIFLLVLKIINILIPFTLWTHLLGINIAIFLAWN